MGTGTRVAIEMGVEHRIKGNGFTVQMVASDFNQRIQVLDYEAQDPEMMIRGLVSEAHLRGYGKIFVKAPAFDQEALEDAGMVREASITGYFSGQPAVVMSLYLRDDRMERPYQSEQDEILEAIFSRPPDPAVPNLPDGYRMVIAEDVDLEKLAELYQKVFDSYPFPITDPDYLLSTMQSHVIYRIVRDAEGFVVAAASAETSRRYRNAEMTDFATLPNQRGLGLAQHILAALEDDMADLAIPNVYTIARARSFGMNRVFYNRGYEMTGTLINNCHISGQFEDMHVWGKTLESSLQS
jgi:putative beta-lysine N-acetyltransferase